MTLTCPKSVLCALSMLPWLCELYAGECLVEMPATFAATACRSDLR